MSQIQEVKDAVDIVEVINERLDLKRSGRNFRALCPFHSEKSPSFFVSSELQRYKCFGCGESGDVFNFLEKYEGMTFSEALRQLAERAGIKLKEYQPSAADAERDELLEILNLAKEYYHYLLTEHEAGQTAREYLRKRQTTSESIKLFQLGYALPNWDGLIKYLHQKKGYALEQLVKTGLVIKRRGRYYDRFRQRIIFPLKNHRGQVVGFSGRILLSGEAAKEQGAKYINTPETQLYHKSELLYGYHELLQFIRQKDQVVVTEGEFDVISSTQAHVNQVVAIKGSAFTVEHASYLKRVVSQVLFALDMDSAGVEATKRAIPIAQEAGLELRVVQLADFEQQEKLDPDDLARENPKLWRDKVKNSISAYQFLIEAALAQYDAQTPEGKRHIIQELAPSLAKITHEVEKDYYVKELAKELEVSSRMVAQDVKAEAARQTQGRTRSRSDRKQDETQSNDQTELSRRQRLEKYLWFILTQLENEQVKTKAEGLLAAYQFQDELLQSLLKRLNEFEPTYTLEKFSQFLPSDLQDLLLELHLEQEYLDSLEKLDLKKEWRQTLKELKTIAMQKRIKEITAELDKLDQKSQKNEAEDQRQSELLEEIVSLKAKLKNRQPPK